MKKTIVESANRFLCEDDEMSTGIKLYVDSIAKEVTEDNYEQGEIGKTQLMMDEKVGKTFNSFEEFKQFAEKHWYFVNNDAWSVIDNRIIYQRQENDNGDEVVNTDPEWKKFVAGEINLWNANYDFVVKLIVPAKSDEDAIRGFTGIKN